MDVIVYLIALALIGLIVGALARLAMPGPDPMGLLGTIGVGIAGSFLAGLVVWVLTGEPQGAGLLLSILGAMVIVYLIRRSRGGGLTDPGRYR